MFFIYSFQVSVTPFSCSLPNNSNFNIKRKYHFCDAIYSFNCVPTVYVERHDLGARAFLCLSVPFHMTRYFKDFHNHQASHVVERYFIYLMRKHIMNSLLHKATSYTLESKAFLVKILLFINSTDRLYCWPAIGLIL